jgi:hypothetical protein
LALIKVRLLPLPREYKIGVLSFYVTIFQRNGPHVIEKNILGYERSKRLGGDCISIGLKENLHLQVF